MSDVMLYGVLRMPYEMAMSNEMSRLQFYGRVQEAVRRMEVAEAKLEELGHAAPPSPSTAPTVDDLAMLVRQLVHSLKKAKPDSDLAARAADYLQRKGLAGSPLRSEAALASRPAGEVELPPLPLGIGSGEYIHRDDVRAYGQECARAALASKPEAIDAEEIVSVITGALVDDLLPHHSPEWVERARSAIAQLRVTRKEPPCGS